MSAEGFDERTVRAIIAFLEASKHRVHQGAAKRVAEHFLPDGRINQAREIAAEKGWPLEAVLAGLEISDAVRSPENSAMTPTPTASTGALVEALRRIAEGKEPRPVGKTWRADATPSKHDMCVHGILLYEACGNCTAEFAANALASISEAPAEGWVVVPREPTEAMLGCGEAAMDWQTYTAKSVWDAMIDAASWLPAHSVGEG